MKGEKVPREKDIPKIKKTAVKEFEELIKKNRTMLIASCKSLPGFQFHDIKKKLRGKAEIKFGKKSIILRAIDGMKKGALNSLKKELDKDFVIIFSEIEPFALSGILSDNQSSAKAKAGDISPEDIKIEPGQTDLLAGPAISELQGVGLKVKVTDGKLEIIKGAMVVKKDEEINKKVASVLEKLDIKPMKVGFIPIAAYDSEDDKVYTEILIDKESALEILRNSLGKGLGFAVKINYVCKETISYFIAKAGIEEKAIEALLGKVEEKVENKKVEERKEESKDVEKINEGGEINE
jgi:large subunit ribosomal protein L10